MPDSTFKLAHPLARMLVGFVVVVVVVLSSMVNTSVMVRAEIITNSIFVPCATNPLMTVTNFNYNYDTSDNTISISVTGTANDNVQGFNEKVNAQVQLVMQSFSNVEAVNKLGEACDLFSGCPNNEPAVKKGTWSLEKKGISLSKPIPWIDYNITVRMPFESGRGNYFCATIPITQALESYNPLAGQISAVLPPLALVAGLLDTYLSQDYSLLTFVMGDGSSFRLPGFFDLWEHAQWIVMTGMLGTYYTRPYEAFVSGFGWSFFNWNISFIDAMAGESMAQPGHLVPSSPVIGSGSGSGKIVNAQDAAATHRLVARQQLPACSPNNPGPAGACSNPSHCCSVSGYCGEGPTYCGEGSGPAANSKSPATAPAPSTSTTHTNGNSGTGSPDQATTTSDDNAIFYSSTHSGITAYANYVGVATDRLVHVTFYTFIFAMLIYLVVAAIGILVYGQVRNYRGVYSKTWPSLTIITDGAIGILLRLAILGFLPLLLTSMHHLALPSTSQFGAGGVAIASITIMILLSGPVYLLFLIFTRHSPTALFDSSVYLLRLGPLYNTFVAGRIRYAVVPIFRRVIYAVIIGAGQKSGVAQLACLIVFEIGFVLLEMWLVPRSMAFGNQLAASTGMLRTIGWLFVIPLLRTLSLSEGKRQIATFAFVLFHLLLLLLWLLLIIRSLVCILLRYRAQSLFNTPGASNGRQRPVIRHAIHQQNDSGENGTGQPTPNGTGNLGSPMTVGDFEFIVRDGGDSFDRYHPPTGRFSAVPRASVISGAYSATGSIEPSSNNSNGNNATTTTNNGSGSMLAGVAGPGTPTSINNGSLRYTHKREDSQTMSIDSTPTSRPRRQSDADFLRSSTPTTTDALIAPSRGYITDGTGNSSLRSYPDTADYAGTPADGAYLDDDAQSQGDELFYYGGGEVPSTTDDASATGAASANQPRLIPAFLRQHDAQDSSGDEMGMQNQTTFPRYMRRAETHNQRA
ncbi:hypothetical protein BDF22DRAFT_740104 [Syncephalis plumigaleata]|nr:hypothetical protein BDF22DRAFT_740104 [Syncephalis plumigaleata]